MIERLCFLLVLALSLAPTHAQQAARNDSELAAVATDAVTLDDGPYVSLARGARRVLDDGTVAAEPLRRGWVTISAVDDVPAFEVRLRRPPEPARSVERLDPRTPLLVVADTHGEYSILVALLKEQGIIDETLRWSFGKGHLAVTGDMLDRGPRQLEILWLLYRIESEARAAGGRVHVLLGNHEAMVLRGDQRYLNPRYPEVARRLGVSAYSDLLGADTVLGGWLRSRPAVLKLGDLLLLHGGISPQITASGLSLDAINAVVRRHLDIPHTLKPAEGSDDALVMGSDGPLWYRGYFPSADKPPAASDEDVSASLTRFGVSRILVGHTIVESVRPLYGGKVIAVQVYPRLDETSGAPILEGALRLKGTWYRTTAQGARTALDPAN